jgi:hypothetical protein
MELQTTFVGIVLAFHDPAADVLAKKDAAGMPAAELLYMAGADQHLSTHGRRNFTAPPYPYAAVVVMLLLVAVVVTSSELNDVPVESISVKIGLIYDVFEEHSSDDDDDDDAVDDDDGDRRHGKYTVEHTSERSDDKHDRGSTSSARLVRKRPSASLLSCACVTLGGK